MLEALGQVFQQIMQSLIIESQDTSRLRREFAYPLLLLQGFTLISPFEGFSHCAIEVIDEFKNAVF